MCYVFQNCLVWKESKNAVKTEFLFFLQDRKAKIDLLLAREKCNNIKYYKIMQVFMKLGLFSSP